MELDDGTMLPQSGAILYYLPEEKLQRSQVLRWMFFEQGWRALGVMERHLGDREFFFGERPRVADVAL